MGFEKLTEYNSRVFTEFAVFGAESSGEMTIDVKFPNDFALYEYGYYDFGLCFEGASQIARVRIDVIDDDGSSAGSSGSTNALVQGDTGVRSYRAAEGTENQHVGVSVEFQHVKPDPVIASEPLMKDRDNGLHERFGRRCFGGKSIELGNYFRGLNVCGGH